MMRSILGVCRRVRREPQVPRTRNIGLQAFTPGRKLNLHTCVIYLQLIMYKCTVLLLGTTDERSPLFPDQIGYR